MMQRVLMLYQENNVVEAISVLKQNIDLPAARILLSALSLDRPTFASLNIGNVGGSQTLGVTGGISEALVSTASGLVVAIFNLFAVSIFRGFYTRQTALIQEYANRFELIYSRRYEDSRSSSFHA